MKQTVIGLFDQQSDAMKAREALMKAGYDESDLFMRSGSDEGVTTGTMKSGHEGGLTGWFRETFGVGDDDDDVAIYSEALRRGGSLLGVQVDEASQVQGVQDVLYAYGAVHPQERASLLGRSDTGAMATGAAMTGDHQKISVVQEELQVGKREVQRGGLRVFTRIVETPVQETVRLRDEQATIERRPVDRPATEADFAALKGGSIEIVETDEEAVVSKQARVVEEIEVGKQVTEREQVISDTVRHTDVQVERLGADATTTAGTATTGTTTAGTTGAGSKRSS